VTYRRWKKEDYAYPVGTVGGGTEVWPEIEFDAGYTPPPVVEIRREYANVIQHFLGHFRHGVGRHVDTLRLVSNRSGVARYETRPVMQLPPYEWRTCLVYLDYFQRSLPLNVTGDVVVKTESKGLEVTVVDPTGTVPGKWGLRMGRKSELTTKVEAPVDPAIELFALSPVQRPEGDELGLNLYLQRYLTQVERDLFPLEELSFYRAPVREAFFALYDEFLGGSGQIYVEFEETRLEVGPEGAQSVELRLHPEVSGPMMLVIGARNLENGRVSLSEPLPLIWDGE
jgi:hypothetical protein